MLCADLLRKNTLCPLTFAVLHNITYRRGFKRADTVFSREGSDRRTSVAILPNLISAVFDFGREPTLESRLSAVYFGILVGS